MVFHWKVLLVEVVLEEVEELILHKSWAGQDQALYFTEIDLHYGLHTQCEKLLNGLLIIETALFLLGNVGLHLDLHGRAVVANVAQMRHSLVHYKCGRLRLNRGIRAFLDKIDLVLVPLLFDDGDGLMQLHLQRVKLSRIDELALLYALPF